MTITPVTIPVDAYVVPQVRVLYRDGFGVDEASTVYAKSSTGWVVLTESGYYPGIFSGVELLKVSRRSLPDIGTASFRWVYGPFADQGAYPAPPNLVNMDVLIQVKMPADPDVAANTSVTPATPGWRTIFWGRVDYQTDDAYAGSATPGQQGTRTYFCVDGFARTMKWIMDRHVVDPNGNGSTLVKECYGHPGYNYQAGGDGIILGNASPVMASAPRGAGTTVTAHVWAGAHSVTFVSGKWTERMAVEHATGATRPQTEPWFLLAGSAARNFGNVTPLHVGDNESVHEFCSRVLNRRRGFALAYVDWVDNGDNSISVQISTTALLVADVTQTVQDMPGSGAATVTLWGINDAAYRDILKNPLTLVGDARNIDSIFQVATAEMQVCDYVETVGEQIEMGVTLSYADTPPLLTQGRSEPFQSTDEIYGGAGFDAVSVEPRWSLDDVSNFEALAQARRIMPYWDHVYQLHGLPRDWQFTICNAGWGPGDSTIANAHRVDYRLLDNGNISAPVFGTDPQDTSVVRTELLGYLPFFQGYDYGAGYIPVKTDNTAQSGMPGRRPAQVYLHLTDQGGDRWFLPNGALPETIADKWDFVTSIGNFNPTLTVFPDCFLAKSDYFCQVGQRVFSSLLNDDSLADAAKLGAAFDITAIAFTLGIKLPHRLRLCTTSPPGTAFPQRPGYTGVADWTHANRRKTVYIPNCQMWLADPWCIWDLDQPTDPTVNIQEGYLARRQALGSVASFDAGTAPQPAVLRTDLARLAFYHLAASGWYLTLRQRARWGQKTCGFLPFARQGTPDDIGPQMGSYIDTLNYNGTATTINLPVTDMDYDHQTGVTVWNTDYFDLEFGL